MRLDRTKTMDDAERLDRFISSLNGEGGTLDSPEVLDPELAATVQALAASYRAPQPDPAFMAELGARFTPAPRRQRLRLKPVPLAPFITRQPRPVVSPPRSPVRFAAANISFALLLLVALAGTFIVARESIRPHGSGFADRSTAVSGAFLALDGRGELVLDRITLQPGATYVWVHSGPAFYLGVFGTVVLESTGDQSVRALRPGDLAATPEYATVTLVNEHDESAEVTRVGIFQARTSPTAPYDYGGIRVQRESTRYVDLELSDAEVATISTRLLALPRGATVATWVVDGESWMMVRAGQPSLTVLSGRTPYGFITGEAGEVDAGKTIDLFPGSTVAVDNEQRFPATIIVLTISVRPAHGADE